ncbi:MAG: hypothetical protein ACR2PY_09215 [Salinispira sp.]
MTDNDDAVKKLQQAFPELTREVLEQIVEELRKPGVDYRTISQTLENEGVSAEQISKLTPIIMDWAKDEKGKGLLIGGVIGVAIGALAAFFLNRD